MSPTNGSLLIKADRLRTPDIPPGPQGDAQGVLIEEGRIVATGPADTLRSRAPHAPLLELPGTTLSPGLTDSHIHLTEWALARREIDLAHADSPGSAAEQVARAARPDRSGWVRGRGWNAQRWNGGEPERALLDAAVPAHPVALQSHDMHALWVNSAALVRAGVDATTPDPPGGRIARDDNGEPTGLLLETAALLVARHVPAPDAADVLDAVIDAQRELHRLGITGIHSLPGVHVRVPDPLGILETMRAADRLRLRVLAHLPVEFLDDAIHLGIRSGFGGEWIRIGGIKSFLDGTLGSRTAWMREPYEDGADTGVRVLPEPEFRDAVRRAAAAGLASTVHAIGDAAVALAVDVLTADDAAGAAIPNRIEHVQCMPPDRLERLGASSVVCSVQPAHLITDWMAADRHWGEARARFTYAFASLLRHGAVLACGSDAPVEPVDPRLGLHAATRRIDLDGRPHNGWFAQERISFEDAFRGYTTGPAIAAGARGRHGCLSAGAPADLVAWRGDPFAEGADPLDMTCVATIVAGVVVHS